MRISDLIDAILFNASAQDWDKNPDTRESIKDLLSQLWTEHFLKNERFCLIYLSSQQNAHIKKIVNLTKTLADYEEEQSYYNLLMPSLLHTSEIFYMTSLGHYPAEELILLRSGTFLLHKDTFSHLLDCNTYVNREGQRRLVPDSSMEENVANNLELYGIVSPFEINQIKEKNPSFSVFALNKEQELHDTKVSATTICKLKELVNFLRSRDGVSPKNSLVIRQKARMFAVLQFYAYCQNLSSTEKKKLRFINFSNRNLFQHIEDMINGYCMSMKAETLNQMVDNFWLPQGAFRIHVDEVDKLKINPLAAKARIAYLYFKLLILDILSGSDLRSGLTFFKNSETDAFAEKVGEALQVAYRYQWRHALGLESFNPATFVDVGIPWQRQDTVWSCLYLRPILRLIHNGIVLAIQFPLRSLAKLGFWLARWPNSPENPALCILVWSLFIIPNATLVLLATALDIITFLIYPLLMPRTAMVLAKEKGWNYAIFCAAYIGAVYAIVGFYVMPIVWGLAVMKFIGLAAAVVLFSNIAEVVHIGVKKVIAWFIPNAYVEHNEPSAIQIEIRPEPVSTPVQYALDAEDVQLFKQGENQHSLSSSKCLLRYGSSMDISSGRSYRDKNPDTLLTPVSSRRMPLFSNSGGMS